MECSETDRDTDFPVAMAAGTHPFPFRTRPLSPPAPMVLGDRSPGRVGRRRGSSKQTTPAHRGGRRRVRQRTARYRAQPFADGISRERRAAPQAPRRRRGAQADTVRSRVESRWQAGRVGTRAPGGHSASPAEPAPRRHEGPAAPARAIDEASTNNRAPSAREGPSEAARRADEVVPSGGPRSAQPSARRAAATSATRRAAASTTRSPSTARRASRRPRRASPHVPRSERCAGGPSRRSRPGSGARASGRPPAGARSARPRRRRSSGRSRVEARTAPSST